MKNLIIAVMLLLVGVASNAVAGDCETALYDNSDPLDIAAALSGKRILATGGGEEWNEDHCASSALYKIGDGSPVDPRAFRGTWSIVSGSNSPTEVEYNYTVGGSSSFTWTVWENTSGGLCWEDSGGAIIATAPLPEPTVGTCVIP